MRKLGLSDNLITAWKFFHTLTTGTDFKSGIKARFLHQRKTGDSFTCLGNTIISMSALAACFDMSQLVCGAFVGDDSLLMFRELPYVADGERDLRLMFNLESKVITEGAPYFCSSLLVSNGTKYALIPDPLKRCERLGKTIYPTDEFTNLKDRWISFADQMHVLEDYAYYESLKIAIASKYFVNQNIECLLNSLYKLVKSEKGYKKLFRAP